MLSALIEQGYVAQAQGRADRRQRLLTLTPAGQALERRLFERQRERLAAAYREAGAAAVDGFRRVMRGIMDEEARRDIGETLVTAGEGHGELHGLPRRSPALPLARATPIPLAARWAPHANA